MRWLIVGAGALGGYFGGRLLEAGEDVTFLLRERRLAQIRASGLVIRSRSGDAHLPVPPCVLAKDISGPYDVVMLGCKAYDLESAMDSFASAVGATTAILPVLNGLSHLDRLSARFGPGHVLGGLAMISAVLDGEGAVLHLNELHTLTYGELDGSHSGRIRAIEAAFARANFDGRASDAIMQDMWEKWVTIATVAGATCLLRAAIGDIVKANAADLSLALLDECAAIAAANGFPMRPASRERIRAFITNADSTMTASMLKDLERGSRSEGEHVIGDLIARAPASEPAPRLLHIVHAHLRAYEARRVRETAAAA